MNSLLTVIYIISFLILIGGTVLFYWGLSKRNWEKIKQLSKSGSETVLQPEKVRFLVSALAEYFPPLIFAGAIAWVIKDEFPVGLVEVIFLGGLTRFAAYPYYSIVIFENRFNGPTRWGWLWGRTEIKFEDIDKDKVLRQRLRRKLGITVIHSNTGQKILTVGLDDQQLGEILNLAM